MCKGPEAGKDGWCTARQGEDAGGVVRDVGRVRPRVGPPGLGEPGWGAGGWKRERGSVEGLKRWVGVREAWN